MAGDDGINGADEAGFFSWPVLTIGHRPRQVTVNLGARHRHLMTSWPDRLPSGNQKRF